MQTFGAFLVTLLAVSGELASALPSTMDQVQPRSNVPTTGGMQVKVRPRAATTYRHPALAMAKAIRKFNATMPSHIDAIVQKHKVAMALSGRAAASGTATTTPEALDEAYITNIQVGTPPQTLPMDFDTGSSDLWVFSSETPTTSVNGQTLYEITKSTTAKQMTGATWQISYGDGSSSSGNVYTDVVTIGNISVQSQAVESATTVSDEFTADSASSGLVGLAMSTLNTVSPTGQKTFFDNAKAQLGSSLFTADLKHDIAGTYTFGALDPAAYTGTIAYANLYNVSTSYSGYWTFQSTGFAVGNGTTTATTATTATAATTNTNQGGGGKKGGHKNVETSAGANTPGRFRSLTSGSKEARTPEPKNRKHIGAREEQAVEKRAVTLTSTTITGIADTGTTLLMLPDEVVNAYYAQVTGAQDSTQEGGWVFSCDQTLPDFSFAVGDGTFTVPGSYINWTPVDATNTTCYGGMQSDSSIGLSIFGDIALKAGYVVFDAAEGRVGWAQKTLTT